MIVIGSQALIAAGLPWRDPKDHDYIMSQEEVEDFIKTYGDDIILTKHPKPMKWSFFIIGSDPVEVEVAADSNSAQILYNIVKEQNLFFTRDGKDFVIPEVVYALKMSHRFRKNSPHFLKTMEDIWSLRQYLKTEDIHPTLQHWIKLREKETYNYAHPKLNQDKKNFFSQDGVNYIYDHDSIHETVKLFERPAFELVKDGLAEVFLSKDIFFNQIDENIRLATVLEESYTLALERHQIPLNFTPDRLTSFKIALEKVCTSIASGWWRSYAWENYYKVLSRYDENYVDKFLHERDNGNVKMYRGE